jgi:RimJ/RimL family protein N-acetyltransferase
MVEPTGSPPAGSPEPPSPLPPGIGIVATTDRALTGAEIAGFHALVHEPEQREWDPGGESLDLPALTAFFRDVLPARPGQAVLLAKAGERVVGMSAVFTEPGRKRGKLGFGVSSGWQGKGIGAALVEAAVRHAERAGLPRLVAEVFPHNLRAIALLARAGFAIVTPRKPPRRPPLLARFEKHLTARRGSPSPPEAGRGKG